MARKHDPQLLKQIGARVQEVRASRGMTQETLAELMGIEPETLSRQETGHRALSLTTLARAADCLEVTVGDLLDIDRPVPAPELDPLLLEFVRMYTTMDEQHRDLAVRMLRELAK